MRHLVDRQGRDWQVYERSDSVQPERRSLVFDTDGVVRRVRQYPLTWASLPDEALLRLMEGRAADGEGPSPAR